MQTTSLLPNDKQPSLQMFAAPPLRAYAPYGYHVGRVGSRLAFVGELNALLPNGYLIGNGKRAYGTGLMRFYSPDTFSPFGRGGLNAYAYCLGDPVNNVDRDGHSITRIVSQAASLIWGAVGMLSALNKALKTIVRRSAAKAQGMPVPPEYDASSRTNNALIFNGGLGSTLTKVPGVAMAYEFPMGSLGSEASTLVGTLAASVAGVGKLRQLYTDLTSTIQEAKANRLPLLELFWEALKEATGWNRMLGQESAILNPRPEEVLLVQARTVRSGVHRPRGG
ncbi:RHS repeat-associated core domain-containing protein [Pseudomonas kermanshahensis]|uniref:RHS repeat-associated core domain-containing protein n=1 Tax=Pseudomonas kermanshahensis TaxID=2745482 RepID=UPI0023DC15E9|nr:RHS repeat-associated core domain-containing protein [Pseudomonas kermanshahensis]WEL53170.1 RHS repeat-associated core domain-containing protein [Pseudomonas kermanshahensis]